MDDNIKFLKNDEYKQLYISLSGDVPWYVRYLGIYPRAFVYGNMIYVNDEAIYLNNRDYNLLITHEVGHLNGLPHTYFGVMSPYGVVRYLTTWKLKKV